MENTIIDWEGKLFLPREHDLFSKRYCSVQAEWDLITQDQYYQENNTPVARQKYKKNASSATGYWQMGPSARSTDELGYVTSGGGQNSDYSSARDGVAVRFALQFMNH